MIPPQVNHHYRFAPHQVGVGAEAGVEKERVLTTLAKVAALAISILIVAPIVAVGCLALGPGALAFGLGAIGIYFIASASFRNWDRCVTYVPIVPRMHARPRYSWFSGRNRSPPWNLNWGRRGNAHNVANINPHRGGRPGVGRPGVGRPAAGRPAAHSGGRPAAGRPAQRGGELPRRVYR